MNPNALIHLSSLRYMKKIIFIIVVVLVIYSRVKFKLVRPGEVKVSFSVFSFFSRNLIP